MEGQVVTNTIREHLLWVESKSESVSIPRKDILTYWPEYGWLLGRQSLEKKDGVRLPQLDDKRSPWPAPRCWSLSMFTNFQDWTASQGVRSTCAVQLPQSFSPLGNCISLYINKSALWVINKTFVSWASGNRLAKAWCPLEKWRHRALNAKQRTRAAHSYLRGRLSSTDQVPLPHYPMSHTDSLSNLRTSDSTSTDASVKKGIIHHRVLKNKRGLRDRLENPGCFTTKNYKGMSAMNSNPSGSEKNVREVYSLEELTNEFGSYVLSQNQIGRGSNPSSATY